MRGTVLLLLAESMSVAEHARNFLRRSCCAAYGDEFFLYEKMGRRAIVSAESNNEAGSTSEVGGAGARPVPTPKKMGIQGDASLWRVLESRALEVFPAKGGLAMQPEAKRNWLRYGLSGLIAGVLNGIFGAGGGLLVVPMLERQGLEPRKAHATSIAIILPLSLISGGLYLLQGVALDSSQLWTVIPAGLIGAAGGAFLLMKLKNRLLKRIFGVIMILSALRLLFR